MLQNFSGFLFLIFALAVHGHSHAETMEIRIMTTSRATAAAFKKNLDGGVLAPGSFEKTYDRLVASKDIEELDRFVQQVDTDTPQPILLNSPDISNKARGTWKTSLELEPAFSPSKGICDLRWARTTMVPAGKSGDEMTWQTHFSATLGFETWYLLDETGYEDKVVLSMLKISEPSSTNKPSPHAQMIAEGYLIQLPIHEATAMKVKNDVELEQAIAKFQNSTLQLNSFRVLVRSGQKAIHIKGQNEYPEGGIDQTLVEVEPHLAPDRKEVYLRSSGLLRTAPNSSNSSQFDFSFADTLRLGSWKAVTANRNRGAKNDGAVFIIRIASLGTMEPEATIPPQEPLPPAGKTTRVYLVHPRILGESHQQIREALLNTGVPDGDWTCALQNGKLVLSGDVSVHQKVIEVIAPYSAGKSSVDQ